MTEELCGDHGFQSVSKEIHVSSCVDALKKELRVNFVVVRELGSHSDETRATRLPLMWPTILDKIKWNSKPPSPPNQGWSCVKGKNTPFSHLWFGGGGGLRFSIYFVQDCGFKFHHRYMWVEFVIGCLPHCSKRLFSGYSGFPFSSKANISKLEFSGFSW